MKWRMKGTEESGERRGQTLDRVPLLACKQCPVLPSPFASEAWAEGCPSSTRLALTLTLSRRARGHDDLPSPFASEAGAEGVRSNPQSPIPHPSRRGFTLVELLVTITIIGIMAGMVFGALSLAREAARDAATKATIAKLNAIIMQRYESYMTRRVPIQIPPGATPREAATLRLNAIRSLMLMEMPDAREDIATVGSSGSVSISAGGAPVTLAEPALHKIYAASTMSGIYDSAQCLYKIVSMGSPEAMEQFNQSEIGVVDGNKPVFIDAWGTPICFLRWAPGYSSPLSDIQTGNPSSDSDPFDPRRVDIDTTTNLPRDFHMIPLIVSAGPNKKFGINDLDNTNGTRTTTAGNLLLGRNAVTSPPPTYVLDIFDDKSLGAPTAAGTHQDNITNHHIEAR